MPKGWRRVVLPVLLLGFGEGVMVFSSSPGAEVLIMGGCVGSMMSSSTEKEKNIC